MNKNQRYRSKITSAAKEIIHTEGLERLTVSNIAAKCRISKRTFYKFYASKDDLLYSLNDLCGRDLDIPDAKEAIIEKAKEGFSKYGFSKMDIESIAKTAGLNRGTIYRYFSSKEELLECCIQHEFNEVKEIMGPILENTDDPVHTLEQYVTQYCRFISLSYENTLLPESWNQIRQNRKIFDAVKDFQDFFIGRFTSLLKAGKEKGIFYSDINPETVADIMLMIQLSMSFHLKTNPAVDLNGEMKDMMLTMLFNTIKKK